MADNVIVRVPEQQFIRGEDGYSPVVTIENINHGHSVTITDRDHPTGQSFNVMDGDSAYEQAVAGGYTGTEAQFNEELASFKELSDETKEAAPFYAEYGVTTRAEIEAAINDKRQIYLLTAPLVESTPQAYVMPLIEKFEYRYTDGGRIVIDRGYRFSITSGTNQYIAELANGWTVYTNDLSAPAASAEAAAAQALIRMNSADASAQAAAATATTFTEQTVPAAVSTINEAKADALTAVGNAQTTAVGAVQQESATQQAAIQQKGEDVLDSIPADYTELTEDVDDLKSAFDTEISAIRDGLAEETTSYPTVSVTSRRYLKSDGTIAEINNAGFKVSNYIPVDGYETAIITGSSATYNLICAFYDENQAFIAGTGIAGADAKEENKEVPIPQGASYIVIAADSRATIACSLLKWSYDFAKKYENGYIRSVTQWKAGNISGGQEIYNAHPAITNGYIKTADVDYVRRADSYAEGHIYYYNYNSENDTYVYDHAEAVQIGANYIINKSYSHFRARLFDGWSNTVDPSVASETFGLYKYETFATRPVWFGKKWAAIGDSLTEFNSTASIKYHAIISQQNGITVVNLGDGGTGYKATDSGAGDSFMDRVSNVPLDADVITIFGSGNDLGSENEIGTPTDTGTTTLCGCINTTIDNLFARMPLANFGIVTPTPWQQYNPANDQNKMALYAAAIVTICKNRGIPCLDLYHCSGLRPWDSTFKNLAYANADGVHPNNIGHALIAPKFQAFLDSLLVH